MHISVGAMDGHTQLLFYGMCFGPFLVLMAVAYREHRRSSRADLLEPPCRKTPTATWPPSCAGRGPPAGRARPAQRDDEGEESGRPPAYSHPP